MDNHYDQIDGVAIRSPLGPVLVNIFMCQFKELVGWLIFSFDRQFGLGTRMTLSPY